jgi:hypothetical protein
MDYYVQDGVVIVGAAETIDDELKRAPVLAVDQSPATRAIVARLEQPIAMRYPSETPLEKIIADMAKATQTPGEASLAISVAPEGLKAAGVTLSSPAGRVDLEAVPLRTTLRLLLAPMGLAYYVENGRLIISDQESVDAMRPEGY